MAAPVPEIEVGDPVVVQQARSPMAPGDTIASSISSPDGATKVFVSYTSPVTLSGTANPIDNLLDQYVDWLLGSLIRMFQFFDGSAEFWRWLQGMGFGWMWPWFMMFAQFGDRFSAMTIYPITEGWGLVRSAVDCQNAAYLLRTESGDIYAIGDCVTVSHDLGLTWEYVAARDPSMTYVQGACATGGETFVVAASNGIWRWNGAWSHVLEIAISGWNVAVATPGWYVVVDGIRVGTSSMKVYGSSDGVSWSHIGTLQLNTQFYNIVSMQDGTLVACTNNGYISNVGFRGGVQISADGGRTWSVVSPLVVWGVVSVNNVLYTGLGYSDNHGATWKKYDGSVITNGTYLASARVAVYAGDANLVSCIYPSSDLIVSADMGQTWSTAISPFSYPSQTRGAYSLNGIWIPGTSRVIMGLQGGTHYSFIHQ